MKLLIRAASVDLQLRLDNGSSSSAGDLCSEISVPLEATVAFSTSKAKFWVKAALGPQKDSSMIEHKVRPYLLRELCTLCDYYSCK